MVVEQELAEVMEKSHRVEPLAPEYPTVAGQTTNFVVLLPLQEESLVELSRELGLQNQQKPSRQKKQPEHESWQRSSPK